MEKGSDDGGVVAADTTSQESKGTDWAQIGLIVLVVLALVASVIMLITDSAAALKLALLAALWAAVIGVLVGGRYRNQAQRAQLEMELTNEAMQAEVESARQRVAEAQQQAQLVQAPAPEFDLEVLEEIKEELAVVRAQLEELNGRAFEVEPAALRAEARRVMELEVEAHREQFAQAPVVEAEEPPVVAPPPGYSGVPSADAVAGNIGSVSSRRPEVNPLSQLINENKRRAEAEEAEEAAEAQEAPTPATQETIEQPIIPDPEPAPEPEPEEERTTRRGRRRREDHSDGISVAELLARARRQEES